MKVILSKLFEYEVFSKVEVREVLLGIVWGMYNDV